MTHRGPFQPLLFCDSVILSSLSTGPAGRTGDPGTRGAMGHPKGVLRLQQGGEIPLGSLGTTMNVPQSGHPSSEPDVGRQMTPGLYQPPQVWGRGVQGAAGRGERGHPAQAQAAEPPVDIKSSLLHRYRVKNRHNLNHKVYIFHRSNIQYT